MKRARTLAAVLTALAVLTLFTAPAAAAPGPEQDLSPFDGFWSFLRSVSGFLVVASPMPSDNARSGGGDVGPIEGTSTPDGDDEGPYVIPPPASAPGTGADGGSVETSSTSPSDYPDEPIR